MANPILNPSLGDHALGAVTFDLVYTVGASGVLTAVYNGGIKSVTRDSAGQYTFTVNDGQYVGSYEILPRVEMIASGPTTTDGCDGYVTVNTLASTNPGVFTVVFFPKGTSVTPTDIASGNTLCIHIRVKNLKGNG